MKNQALNIIRTIIAEKRNDGEVFPVVSTAEVCARFLGLTQTMLRELSEAEYAGLIARSGSGKNEYWDITENH